MKPRKQLRVYIICACLTLAALSPARLLSGSQHGGDDRFTNHGAPVQMASDRGLWTAQDADGNNLVIGRALATAPAETGESPRGWMLITNVDTGASEQVLAPEDVPAGTTYRSFGVSPENKLYTSEYYDFLEYDIDAREWTFHERVNTTILRIAEGPDGLIWIGGVYRPALISYDPQTQRMIDHGRMDDEERYLSHISFDEHGWVYCGIGTARANLVAYNPETGERRQLVPEERRRVGTGRLELRGDNELYGRIGLLDTEDGDSHSTVYYRLERGEAVEVDESQLPAEEPVEADGRPMLPDGRIVAEYDMPNRYLKIEDPNSGAVTRIEFDYVTVGANIRSGALAVGADGKVYVNTGNPSYFAAYDPEADEWRRFPDEHRQSSLVRQGQHIVGGRYTGGKLKVFDTSQPWDKGENPYLAIPTSRPHINSPFVHAHHDGKHVMMGGMPGYGRAGGGLNIYNIGTGDATLMPHEELIEHHSLTGIQALPNGNLICTTTVAATHGGHAIASEAVIFELDWETRSVNWKAVPIAEMGAVTARMLTDDGLLYGTGEDGLFFVFDIESREVIHTVSLDAYGGGGSMLELPDGKVLMAARDAILEMDPASYEFEEVAEAPVEIGRAVAHGGRVYFISGSELWSYGE